MNWLPVTKRGPKARPRPLVAVCCKGTIDCRSRGINKQSHFVPRFVPSRQTEIMILAQVYILLFFFAKYLLILHRPKLIIHVTIIMAGMEMNAFDILPLRKLYQS